MASATIQQEATYPSLRKYAAKPFHKTDNHFESHPQQTYFFPILISLPTFYGPRNNTLSVFQISVPCRNPEAQLRLSCPIRAIASIRYRSNRTAKIVSADAHRIFFSLHHT